MQKLILASASKSRSQILLNAGVDFSIQVSNIDETPIKNRFSLKPAEDIALKLAVLKAQKISKLNTDALVIDNLNSLHNSSLTVFWIISLIRVAFLKANILSI